MYLCLRGIDDVTWEISLFFHAGLFRVQKAPDYDADKENQLPVTARNLKDMAHACGFELAGATAALPSEDLQRFAEWRNAGRAAEMTYLTDRRGDLRADPRHLLPGAQSILCLGKLYQTAHPLSVEQTDNARGWISRYAWGADYHDVVRAGLERLLERIRAAHGEPFDARICVDTAPLLERSYARAAGLGWIGKNTCLINERRGSWFFLGEILLSIPLDCDSPPPDRCGTCRRCIDACPTDAIVQNEKLEWTLDSRRCISYMTIEKRGGFSTEDKPALGNHLFGCDICQDVCPWNGKSPFTPEVAFEPATFAPHLAEMAMLSEEDFRRLFRKSPVWRAKYEGFLRNVALALGQSSQPEMKKPLEYLARNANAVIANTARKALGWLPAILLALLLMRLGVAADAPVSAGYDHFYNNEFDQALEFFDSDLKAHPDDPQMSNHVAQGILYREMLRSGALESQMVSGNNPFLRRPKMEISAQDKQRFEHCVNEATSLSEAKLQKQPNDVEALAALSVVHGLRSNYLFLVEKSWTDALREATAARKANERIREIDPKDVDARLVFGLNEYVVGSLPFYMRALGFLGGFHGDRADGIRQLELVAKQGAQNRYDAQVLLAAIYRRERDPRKAIPLLKELAARFPRNHLFRLEEVQMYSDAGDKQSALAVLNEIENMRKSGAPGYAHLNPEKIRYFRGNLLFWYNNLPEALADLSAVTQKASDLDLNTAVLAWLRLGQVEDLQGHHAEALSAYREAIKTAPKSEAATEAKGYMDTPYHRKDKA
jgi:epoxyqueuosine reductase